MTAAHRTPKLSDRTCWRLDDNALSKVVAEVRSEGIRLLDLTESNPTRCGLAPGVEMIGGLSHPSAARYEPIPFGDVDARAAVAAYYGDRGVTVEVARIALSASTSEAYGWLFKLLCDPDDAVLVPQPSYPLFEILASLEDVRLVPYPLVRDDRFRIDLDALECAIEAEPRARALLLVNPNNPTGTFARREEAEALERIAGERGLALIVDEVFADYAHGTLPGDRVQTFAGRDRALTFVLSGLSKVVALPQVKLAWTVASGPSETLDRALARLEVIADTYLSVSTPIQRALPSILANRAHVQRAILARVEANLRTLDRAIADTALSRLPSDGGWSAILQVPRTRDEDGWVHTLVRDDAVIVHPGWFFDLERDGFLVVSLLPEEPDFAEAIRRLVARIAAG